MRIPLVLLAAALLSPAATAHSTFEANELEIHLLNDEGTDVMQEYGGYDINELFLGVAHDPSVGAGDAGDGFYFRLEAYGEVRHDPPSAAGPWRLVFHYTTAKGEQQRSITTDDGVTFDSDFDGLTVQPEGVELHVLRAFVSFAGAGVAPGEPLAGFRVESFVGDDLRDAAPGPLYLPGSGGRIPYDEPTALPGQGALVANATLPSPAIYLKEAVLSGAQFNYTIVVTSALTAGGQHILLQASEAAGWSIEGSPAVSVPANGTATFHLRAEPQADAQQLRLDIVTDVGGRVPVTVHPDGRLQVGGAAFLPPAPAPEPSPAAGLLLALACLGLAAAARRRTP